MSITNTTLMNSAAASIYTSSGDNTVVTMYFCNTDSSDRTINLYLVPAADTAGTGNQIIKNLNIAAGDTYITNYERLVLANGESIQANASVNSVVVSTVNYTAV